MRKQGTLNAFVKAKAAPKDAGSEGRKRKGEADDEEQPQETASSSSSKKSRKEVALTEPVKSFLAELHDPSWREALSDEFTKDYFVSLVRFLQSERKAGKKIYPPQDLVFNAFNLCPYDDVRVVIIGQDPYHGAGQGMGLCFSVQLGVAVPPSLRNIYKELDDDEHLLDGIPPASTSSSASASSSSSATSSSGAKKGKGKAKVVKPGRSGFLAPGHGNLEKWARQGVLMINAILTVEAGKAGSHKGKGWEKFTDAVIKKLNSERQGIVFMLWGGPAQDKGKSINKSRHHVLTSVHPSPMAARSGSFVGCRHFSSANKFLVAQGKTPIDWRLDSAEVEREAHRAWQEAAEKRWKAGSASSSSSSSSSSLSSGSAEEDAEKDDEEGGEGEDEEEEEANGGKKSEEEEEAGEGEEDAEA